jgi:hypothetical protein
LNLIKGILIYLVITDKMGFEKNLQECEVRLIGDVLRLVKKNVPVLLVWQNKGELKHLGTGNMSDWLTTLGNDVREDLSGRMVEDMLGLNNKTS